MSINAISGVSSGISQGGGISEATIRRLKELGIDPNSVTTEAQAKAKIAEAEKQNKAQKGQEVQAPQQQTTGETDVKMQAMDSKAKNLTDDIGKLAEKIGVSISQTDTPKVAIEKIEAKIDSITNNKQVSATGLSNDQKVQANPEDLKAELQDVKTKLNDLDQAKASAYAGQDMMAMMNRMALGI